MRRLLNAVQVGEILGVSENTARQYMRQHMACVMLPGGGIRVEEAELERWTNQRRVCPMDSMPAKAKRPAPRVYDLDLFEPDGRIKRRRA